MNDATSAAAAASAYTSSSRLLTVRDVMEHLRCSRSLVYALVGSGKLRPVKLGRAVRFTSANVSELAEG